ncbi:PAAR domain-containing protein [Actinoplanes sp. NPDC023714]|uniref:PAAR domain-containing protein n=1 Tax=Actinoplanes sp. NPDC023714 TaxID=3154322 RepID=UPI0033ED2E52
MPGAARAQDSVTGTDTHIVLVPNPAGAVPTPLPHPFSGTIVQEASPDVLINGRPAATVGSVALNQPPHVPTPPGTSFARPPANRGTVALGSATVRINGRAAARTGDPVRTCNDPADLPVGAITSASADVLIG